MMKSFLIVLLFLNFSYVVAQELPVTTCNESQYSISTYSKANEIQAELSQLVKDGVPGVSIAVYSEEGEWTANAGFARIEGEVEMQSCHLHYLQSISKTYMAIGILKLYEQGKIDLDAPMTQYLPGKYSHYISDADKITVRMLLNHTSGIPEYNQIPAYITKLLQHPDYFFSSEEYLKYIEGKPLSFVPGSKYSYRNTNYLILALIADELTGDHARFLSEVIFKPLELTTTFYRGSERYLTYSNLVNAYWDRHSDGVIENASTLQRNNVLALIGDDGVVATPEDAVKFLKGLIEGKLLLPATMELMKSWTKDKNGNPTYGLGLDYATLGGQVAYGHSGGGIGEGCQLYYFPDHKVYTFIGINLGTVTDSPLHEKAATTLDRIYKIILK